MRDLPPPHESFPPSSHLPLVQVFEDQLFLDIEVETKEGLVGLKVSFSEGLGVEGEDDWGIAGSR